MKDPYLLHMFNPTKNVSPFDVNMAYEAEFDGVIPYSEVTLEDIYALTQDTIFSRGPKGAKRTGIFIGGRDFGLAIDMLHRAKTAMVPPFEVPVFADPSGAITTAAALMACIELLVQKKSGGNLQGRRVDIFGGTGPVGICAGILAANCGAEVYLVSSRGAKVGEEYALEYNSRFHVNMHGGDSTTDDKILESMPKSEIIIGATKAGVQVLSREQLQRASNLIVAADTNERNTGGDWLFWFSSQGNGGLPVRVQAKRLYASGRYEQLYHPFSGPSKQGYSWKNQCEALLGYAQIDGAIPLYIFYNSDRLFAQFTAHQRLAWWKNFSLPSQCWGISTTSPLAVKNANWGKSDRVGDFFMVPWHCLVCSSCWNSRPTDFSLPSRIGHYLRQLYRYSGGKEGALANLSELDFSFEPINATPKWVGLLHEGVGARGQLLEEMDSLNLQGVAILEETEARYE